MPYCCVGDGGMIMQVTIRCLDRDRLPPPPPPLLPACTCMRTLEFKNVANQFNGHDGRHKEQGRDHKNIKAPPLSPLVRGGSFSVTRLKQVVRNTWNSRYSCFCRSLKVALDKTVTECVWAVSAGSPGTRPGDEAESPCSWTSRGPRVGDHDNIDADGQPPRRRRRLLQLPRAALKEPSADCSSWIAWRPCGWSLGGRLNGVPADCKHPQNDAVNFVSVKNLSVNVKTSDPNPSPNPRPAVRALDRQVPRAHSSTYSTSRAHIYQGRNLAGGHQVHLHHRGGGVDQLRPVCYDRFVDGSLAIVSSSGNPSAPVRYQGVPLLQLRGGGRRVHRTTTYGAGIAAWMDSDEEHMAWERSQSRLRREQRTVINGEHGGSPIAVPTQHEAVNEDAPPSWYPRPPFQPFECGLCHDPIDWTSDDWSWCACRSLRCSGCRADVCPICQGEGESSQRSRDGATVISIAEALGIDDSEQGSSGHDAGEQVAVDDQMQDRSDSDLGRTPWGQVPPFMIGNREGRRVGVCTICCRDFPLPRGWDSSDESAEQARCPSCYGPLHGGEEVRGEYLMEQDWDEINMSSLPAFGWDSQRGEVEEEAEDEGVHCSRCLLDLRIPGVTWRICRCGKPACEGCASEACRSCGQEAVWAGQHDRSRPHRGADAGQELMPEGAPPQRK